MIHLPIRRLYGDVVEAAVEFQQREGTCFSSRGAMPLEKGRKSENLGDIVDTTGV